MKYAFHPTSQSYEEREAANQWALAQVSKKPKKPYLPTEVYNRFTGKGGLHHLSFSDFPNYAAYSKAKKEIEQGQFFTPHQLCQEIIQALQPEPQFLIADLSCGKGSFFNFLPDESRCYGCEIDPEAYKVCKYLYPAAHIKKGDFNYYNPAERFDLIVGNPPFNLITDFGLSQWAYLEKAFVLLKYGGLLAFIIPDSFLADEFQDRHRIEWLNNRFHCILQSKLPSGSFNAIIDTKLLVLQKRSIEAYQKPYLPDCFIPFESIDIYQYFIGPIYAFNKANAAKLHLYALQQAIGSEELGYRVKKCLWHIKSSPALCKKYYQQALRRIDEIKTKQRPKDMTEGEWERQKPTPDKVLHWIKHILRHQNDPKPQKVCKVVKTAYGLKCKAYHKALQKEEWKKSVHDLLLTGERFGSYRKLYDRKQAALLIQDRPFVSLSRDAAIDQFLDRLRFRPKWKALLRFKGLQPTVIELNPMQKEDLGLLLQKRYAILAWEQGGGKSVAGMTWLTYWKGHYRNAFILAPALAINTTWQQRLSVYGFDFLHLQSISDLERVKPGQILLISYEALITLQNAVKDFVKRKAYKVALLVDESDELTNSSSQRSMAALNCFRKAKLKLLTTGTTTRNTINELYTQLELVYNNSSAFRCWAETIYKTEPDGSLREETNEQCGYPFPAYRGKALFKAAFCPQRITVFGIRQNTQDVFNAQLLKDIIAKTIITRKFEEIVGEKKYVLRTHVVQQNRTEQDLYRLLMEEFLTVCYDYYTSTGNRRKETALRLLRQIKALIKATSTPHLMPHYIGSEKPAKYQAIARMVESWPNELVTIGTTFKETAKDYYNYLHTIFPNRPIFYIDGEVPVSHRLKILEQFQLSENGIMNCTQQSLKSSVDIPYCKKCIIESLQWNIPKISQFFFRFIRFNSIGTTEVHFVNYQNTIEVNLLALLMAKEKLNDFIKTTNEKTSEAIYHQYGIDLNILDALISKEWDSEGKLKLRWGQQTMY